MGIYVLYQRLSPALFPPTRTMAVRRGSKANKTRQGSPEIRTLNSTVSRPSTADLVSLDSVRSTEIPGGPLTIAASYSRAEPVGCRKSPGFRRERRKKGRCERSRIPAQPRLHKSIALNDLCLDIR